MNTALIKFFGYAPTTGKKLDPVFVLEEAAKRGYVVHPDCCTEDVLNFVCSEEFNPNSTFYRTWSDITDKTRLELLIDQLFHYASTYGTDFEGEVYCPNGEPININYKTYKVIRACTDQEMFNMCMNVLSAGSALANETLKAVVDYVVEKAKSGFKLDIDKIANRDAMCKISADLGIFPTRGEDIVRALYYKVFGNPTLIQGNQMMRAMYRKSTRPSGNHILHTNIELKNLSDKQKYELAKVFHRYKRFLLGLKTDKNNSHVINQIRRMAVRAHKPMVPGFWENLTNLPLAEVESRLPNELKNLDNKFKIVRLMQMIALRKLQNGSGSCRIFAIRNGKLWVDYASRASYEPGWAYVYVALAKRLTSLLNDKMKEYHNGLPVYIKFPKDFNLVCPASERQFLGNIPYGSSFEMKDYDNIFGVYWRNEWGTRDYDLSYIDERGQKIGWNADFKGEGMMFSGDMTNADPEATECFYTQGVVPNGTVLLNRYSGEPNSKFRLFFAQETVKDFGRGYMVDPSSIMVSEMGISTAREQLVAAIMDGKAYLGVFDLAGSRVSAFDPDLLQAYHDRLKSYIPLKEMLLAAGFQEYTPEISESGVECDIDLTDLKKDTILSLFS